MWSIVSVIVRNSQFITHVYCSEATSFTSQIARIDFELDFMNNNGPNKTLMQQQMMIL